MTTIYLSRHSQPLTVNSDDSNDSFQVKNEKTILSIDGEKIAERWSNTNVFNNIDYVYSSNYIRSISTAKYVSEKNNLTINIDDDLGERKFGVSNWSELPERFERKQYLDENYKIGNGDSQKEVRERMRSAIMKILNKHKNSKIAIVSHGTAISWLLMLWCKVELVDDKLKYSFKGEELLHGYFRYCETFELTFDDNNNILNIRRVDIL